MFVLNGIVYGGEPDEPLKVNGIKILPDRMMLITFSNGEIRLFDSTILQGSIFKKLSDENVFNSALIDHGVVTWADGEIDCAPEFMYENSFEYPVSEIV